MKKTQFPNKILLIALALVPVLSNAQTMPPTFAARWIECLYQKCRGSNITIDTTMPPKKKCVQWEDSCRRKAKPDHSFVNHDSLIRKQVLRNWKLY